MEFYYYFSSLSSLNAHNSTLIVCVRAVSIHENDQTRDRWLDFRRMQVASDQITFLVESSDDITQDSEVFVPVRIILDSVSLTR